MGRRTDPESRLAADKLGRRNQAARDPHERSWWPILWRGLASRRLGRWRRARATRPIGSASSPSAITPKAPAGYA